MSHTVRVRLLGGCSLASVAFAAACGGGGGNPDPQNQPPTASFSADVSSGFAALTVNFNAAASADPDGTVASFEWDFDGDGTVDQNRAQPTATFTYPAAGSFAPRLRVVDDDGASAVTTGSVAVEQLELAEALMLDNNAVGQSLATLEIGGRFPSVAVQNNVALLFVHTTATDPELEFDIAFIELAPTTFRQSLAEVDGNPAVLYGHSDTRDLVYARADDAPGTTWSTLTTLPMPATARRVPGGLTVAAGNPAALFQQELDGVVELLFLRADDEQGAQWNGTPVRVFQPAEVFASSNVVFAAGNPAVAGQSGVGDGQRILYKRARDAAGSDWPADPVVVASTPELFGVPSAIQAGSNPAMIFARLEGGAQELLFARALDAEGSAWEDPRSIFRGDFDTSDVAFINGRIVVLLTSDASDESLLLISADATGATFPTRVRVAGGARAGGLLEVGGGPAAALVFNNDLSLFSAL